MVFCFGLKCLNTSASSEENIDSNGKSGETGDYGIIESANQPQEIKRTALNSLCISLKRLKIKKSEISDKKPCSNKKVSTKKQRKENQSKNVSFSWENGRRKSTTCSGGPMYDYIDAENGSVDPVYSRVDENPGCSHRYDYPTFATYSRQRNAQEPFYTSASQIYSVASDDPYSSIISESENARGIPYDIESSSSVYDVGYEKVPTGKDILKVLPKTTRAFNNRVNSNGRESKKSIDALYSKINRPLRSVLLNDRSTNDPLFNNMSNTDLHNPSNDGNEDNSLIYQMEGSATGSVGSNYTGTGSSKNPSYRYLTVRESVDVIRERIRRQEMENNAQQILDETDSLPAIVREHYYSTIANEYESVGGDEGLPMSEGSRIIQENANAPLHEGRNHNQSRLMPSHSLVNPSLSLMTGSSELNKTHSSHDSNYPPRPPTSPIPNRSLEKAENAPIMRPVIISPKRTPIPASLLLRNIKHNYAEELFDSIKHLLPRDRHSAPRLLRHNVADNFLTKGNGDILPPPPTTVLPIIPTASLSDCRNDMRSQQRYSYSYDSRSSQPNNWIESESTKARLNSNNMSAVIRSCFETVPALNLLPPLPTSSIASKVENISNFCEISEPNSCSRPLASRIPVPSSSSSSSTKNHIRSRTPSPTVEIGVQTIEFMSESLTKHPSVSFRSSDKLSNEFSNKKSARKLDPPPQPIGNDYISPMDLSGKRGWPLVQSHEKINSGAETQNENGTSTTMKNKERGI